MGYRFDKFGNRLSGRTGDYIDSRLGSIRRLIPTTPTDSSSEKSTGAFWSWFWGDKPGAWVLRNAIAVAAGAGTGLLAAKLYRTSATIGAGIVKAGLVAGLSGALSEISIKQSTRMAIAQGADKDLVSDRKGVYRTAWALGAVSGFLGGQKNLFGRIVKEVAYQGVNATQRMFLDPFGVHDGGTWVFPDQKDGWYYTRQDLNRVYKWNWSWPSIPGKSFDSSKWTQLNLDI